MSSRLHDQRKSSPIRKPSPDPKPLGVSSQQELNPELLRQVIASPTRANLTPAVVQSLQHLHGNHLVQRLVKQAEQNDRASALERQTTVEEISRKIAVSQMDSGKTSGTTIQRNGFDLLPNYVIHQILSYLPKGDLLALRQMSTRFRRLVSDPRHLWTVLWENNIQEEVVKKLGNVKGMKPKDKKSALKLSVEETKEAAQQLILMLANPRRGPAATSAAIAEFEQVCFRGFAPPKDLHTFLMEIMSVKSLMLDPAGEHTLRPGPESKQKGQEAPDYEYLPNLQTRELNEKLPPTGKGDNFDVSGVKDNTGQLVTEPNRDDPTMKSRMDQVYNSIIKGIKLKLSKYANPDNPVIVTASATDCPWLEVNVIRERIAGEVENRDQLQFFIVIGGVTTHVWPPD